MDPFMAELSEMVVGSHGGGTSMDDADNYDINNNNESSHMMPEVVEEVAGQLTAGFQFSNASHISEMQGGDHNNVSIDMSPHQQVPARPAPPAPVQLIRAIWTISFFTLLTTIRAALYNPTRGVFFSHYKIAYYLLLSAIFAAGLGEAFTAFWLSRPGGCSLCHLNFGRAVLCASMLPFVTVLGIARYGFMED